MIHRTSRTATTRWSLEHKETEHGKFMYIHPRLFTQQCATNYKNSQQQKQGHHQLHEPKGLHPASNSTMAPPPPTLAKQAANTQPREYAESFDGAADALRTGISSRVSVGCSQYLIQQNRAKHVRSPLGGPGSSSKQKSRYSCRPKALGASSARKSCLSLDLMGQTLSCQLAKLDRKNFFQAVKEGDTQQVKLVLQASPCLVKYSRWFFRRLTALHLAACEGQLEVLKVLLDHGGAVDAVDRFGKTPLMLASKRGNWACALQLLETGANVVVFGSSRERSCLHYAASGGNVDCVKRILQQVAASRDVSAGFVNAYDRCGITALHLASLGGHLTVIRVLLEAGASPTAAGPLSNHYNGLCKGERPLHYAARGGSVECIKELLAWGAERRCRNNDGYTAYDVAVSYHNFACAAILDPANAEPLVWPLPFKFISQVEPEARKLLEAALRKANETDSQTPTCSQELGMSKELCSICFERACTMQVGECGHRLCATCTLMLCCHSKPDSSSPLRPPLCPFCRGQIGSILLVRSVSRFKLKSSSGRIADTSWICSSYNVPTH